MVELLRSNDLVFLGWAEAVLAEAGIEVLRLDEHASAIDGSIGAIPRRLMVPHGDEGRARAVIARAQAALSGDGA
ncbi:putative signal transducing protein [Marinivivus vitaminiproducens]|uniref:putative signal transducing protein n=1 Tax=Marinivivus vitaminiproducens TaxID=3035935 RepID=UPI0027A65F38|nr:DUF2007 domain-containing protein [Geminicoccaceae bacterium SCSIO 64248]